MDGLIKLVLIKSAKFDFNEIDIDGNSLFIGANGAGKTTLLRAILYFYTADSRSLGISSSKKISFSDYYFEYEHSYLVYIYKKDDKYVLVTVYKQANNIKFRFCLFGEQPNIKDIFIEDDKPIEHSKLWIKLRELGLLSNPQNGVEYKKTLYSKNTKLQYLSLFEAKEYDGFVKTLSNIFINNKVDSDAIKKVIVSSLDVDKKIDIDSIKRYLETFNTTYQDILTYTKHQKTIITLISFLNNYEQNKNDTQENFSTLANSKDIVNQEIKNIQNKNITLKEKETTLTAQKTKENELFSKKVKKLNESIGVIKQKIKTTKEKSEFYKQENIDEKITKYDSLSSLNNELQVVLKQREFLTKEHQELEQSHQNQLQAILNQYISEQNEIQNSKSNQANSKSKKILQINTKLNDDKQELFNSFIKDEDGLKIKQNKFTFDTQELKHNLSNTKKENYIFKYQEQLDKLQVEQKDISKNIDELNKSMVSKDSELLSYQNNHHQEMENISQKEQYALQEISKKIEKIQKLINPDKNSLTYKIYENKLDIDKYLYFLNDDALNSNIDITINDKSSKTKIFELDILDFQAPKTTLSNTLKNNVKILEDKQKEFIKLHDDKNKDLRNFENKIYRDKRELDEGIKKLNINLTTITTKISNLINQSKVLSDEFIEDKNIKINKINSDIKNINKYQESLNSELEQLIKIKNTKINSLKSNSTKEINQFEKEYKSKIELLDKAFDNLKIDKKQKENEQIQNYQDLLKTKNIDIFKLEELTIKENQLKKSIKTTNSYATIINNYKYDKDEYFDRLKTTTLNLKLQNNELDSLTLEHNNSIDIITKQHKEITISLNQNNISLSQKENSIQRVNSFEQSDILKRCINLGIKYTPNNSYINIDTLLSNISNLTTSYNELETNINKTISKLGVIFDNSLNIKRELDFIATAYKIQEFEQNNMIAKYKDLLSTNLNQIIKTSIDEYNHLITHSGKIESLVNKITKLFKQISIGVIDELSLRYSRSNNKVIEILSAIKDLNEQNPYSYGVSLFSDSGNSDDMIKMLKKLRDTIEFDVVKSIELEDSFVLEFRVIENGNDSRYQSSLDMIGSNGTDVLVKSMIYIAMLHIFKSRSTKKDVAVSVILDEIGILSQRYLKELIEFANQYSIYFINGAPDEKLIGTYKRVSLVRNINNISIVQELIAK